LPPPRLHGLIRPIVARGIRNGPRLAGAAVVPTDRRPARAVLLRAAAAAGRDPTLTSAVCARCRGILWRASLMLTRRCTSDLSFPTTSALASPLSIAGEGDTMDAGADHAALHVHAGEGDTTDAGAEPAVHGHAELGWRRRVRADGGTVAPKFAVTPEESARPWRRRAAAARLLPGSSEGAQRRARDRGRDARRGQVRDDVLGRCAVPCSSRQCAESSGDESEATMGMKSGGAVVDLSARRWRVAKARPAMCSWPRRHR
jgi:hypothetical protein